MKTALELATMARKSNWQAIATGLAANGIE